MATQVFQKRDPRLWGVRLDTSEQLVDRSLYGVGSSLIRGQNGFTADVVMVDGRPCAKVGRADSPNPRLELV